MISSEEHAAPDPDDSLQIVEQGETIGVSPEEIAAIPALPGVYIMLDAGGKVIYVGKAVNLNSRVQSYFTRSGDSRFNVKFLMRHVERLKTIITANEKEAFLLEDTLIKKYQPRYNIRLRDDKTYVSVRINLNATWPRAVVLRRRDERAPKGVVYLGPYASASAVRETLRQLQRVFPIRSCPDSVLNNRSRPCLLHQIGRCCAPCVKEVDREEYDQMVEGTILFLKGRTGEVLKRLHAQMKTLAGEMEYERAAAVRDRIAAIEKTTERQGVSRQGGSDRDLIVLRRRAGRGAFVVFVYRNGIMVSSRPFLIKDHEREDADLMAEFLTRYYTLEPPPRELLLDPLPRDREMLGNWLETRREARVEMFMPQRGEKRQWLLTAAENAERLLEQHLSGRETVAETLGEIAEKLHLEAPPQLIECYDISTIQGTATVGSMVSFREGEPDKQRYRRFRIKTLEGQDDFGAMREVLTRRLARIVEHGDETPDLIVIDGGKGQLASAVQIREESGLSHIPMVGMAKSRLKKRGEERWRTEERFFLPGRKNPVVLRENSAALYMLQRLRDEAHRFGITYHRQVRGREQLESELGQIRGLGPERVRRLLRHFGSMKKLREADEKAITEVKGISEALATTIHRFLHADDTEELSGLGDAEK